MGHIKIDGRLDLAYRCQFDNFCTELGANKSQVSSITSSINHYPGCSNQYNKKEKVFKNWKEKYKSIICC